MPKKDGHVRTLGGTTRYRLIYVCGKQRLEHRVVMEHVLGRSLSLDEVVHHKDEDGLNNNPSNLEVMTRAEHRRRHGGPRWWSISLEEGIAMRNNGATLKEIGSEAGVTWTAVHHVFKRRKISTKDRRHGTIGWDLDLAIHMREEGKSLTKIGKEVGVSHTTIRKALLKYGQIGEKPQRRLPSLL